MVVVHPVMPYESPCYSMHPIHEECVAEEGSEDPKDTRELGHANLEHIDDVHEEEGPQGGHGEGDRGGGD